MPFLDVSCKNTHLPQMHPQDLLACWERSDTVAVLLVSVSDILQPCTKLASRQFLADIIDIILFFFFFCQSLALGATTASTETISPVANKYLPTR